METRTRHLRELRGSQGRLHIIAHYSLHLFFASTLAFRLAYIKPQKLHSEPGPIGPLRHLGVRVV